MATVQDKTTFTTVPDRGLANSQDSPISQVSMQLIMSSSTRAPSSAYSNTGPENVALTLGRDVACMQPT